MQSSGASQSGSSAGSGSCAGDVEDRAAEVTRSSAAINAASSTSDPRPTLQNSAPGFIAANAAASKRFSVSGGARRAHDHRVAAGEHLVQIGGAAQLVDRGVLLTGLVAPARSDGRHAEGAGPDRDLGADRAQTR